MAPGTLLFTGVQKVENTRITLYDYSKEYVTEVAINDLSLLKPYVDHRSITWINVDGIHDVNLLRTLGEDFGIHPLVLEDILNPHQRPKVEVYPDHLYMVLKMPDRIIEDQQLNFEQLSVVLSGSVLFTFQEREGDCFDGIRERLKNPQSRVRNNGIDYLLYLIIDSIVDTYFVLMEEIADKIESLEEKILNDKGNEYLKSLQSIKRENIFLKKFTIPTREVISQLQRVDNPLIKPETRVFFFDVYDHVIRISEAVESNRELIAGLQDLNLNLMNHRMNEVMKVLAVISTIFLPLTLVSSIYGMNFDWMPELHHPYGYPTALGFMLVLGLGMLYFFKRKHWF